MNRSLRYRLSVVFGTLFGIGYLPYAPGTFGTAATLVLCIFLPTQSMWFLGIMVMTCAVSIPISYGAEQYFGIDDDRRIIIDELVGYMVSVAFLPKTAVYFLAAFVLFRFFDIFKISIIKKSQALPYGIGVVVDDILAGLVTNAILQGVRIIGKIF